MIRAALGIAHAFLLLALAPVLAGKPAGAADILPLARVVAETEWVSQGFVAAPLLGGEDAVYLVVGNNMRGLGPGFEPHILKVTRPGSVERIDLDSIAGAAALLAETIEPLEWRPPDGLVLRQGALLVELDLAKSTVRTTPLAAPPGYPLDSLQKAESLRTGGLLLSGGVKRGGLMRPLDTSTPWLVRLSPQRAVVWTKALGRANRLIAYRDGGDAPDLLAWGRAPPAPVRHMTAPKATELVIDTLERTGEVKHRSVLPGAATDRGTFFASGLVTARSDEDDQKTESIEIHDFAGRKIAEAPWLAGGLIGILKPARDGIAAIVYSNDDGKDHFFVVMLDRQGKALWRTPLHFSGGEVVAANGDLIVLQYDDDQLAGATNRWRLVRYAAP